MPKRKPVRATKRRIKSAHVRGVRDRIVKLIAKAPATRLGLRKATGASMAAIDFHLADLRRIGAIQSDGRRPATFSTGAGRATRGGPTGMSVGLVKALAAVVTRMREREDRVRLKNIDQKLATLEQLSQAMPQPVSKVLKQILTDYRALQR